MAGVDFPDNDFTRMIEAVSSGNRSGLHREGVTSATPLPTVQSADIGREVTELPPLTEAEKVELDRLAVEAGVKDERIGTASVLLIPGDYSTLEEAIKAGSPVNPPVSTGHVPNAPQTVREVLSRSAPRSRLPDFCRVEGIDLVHNKVVLDGMDFPITDEQAAEFKQFVVEVARTAIMEKLSAAVSLFAAPVTAEGPDENTQRAGEVQEV